ncbi:hypothetical protein [Bordetella avium]|uniref:hypothetical protein n=1 Tax=Bordetella avium TaxID=521 RepID=UPI0006910317|nr:hypothetical protein [Bordetella avium]
MDLPGFLTGITFATNAYKAAVEIQDEAKIIAATYDLQAQLTIAGAHCLAMNEKVAAAADSERTLKSRVRDLEEEIADLKRRATERERYELVQQHPGTFTLRIKESARGTEPMHHICPGCMDNRSMKSILQSENSSHTVLKCPACQTSYRVAETPARPSHAILV